MFPLKKISFCYSEFEPAGFFKTVDSAACHILDHLLTANECFFWFEVCPILRKNINSNDCDDRFYAAREMARNPHLFEPVYNEYHHIVQETVFQAESCTGWVAETDTARIYLGINGIIAILDILSNTFVTAYLGGSGDPIATASHLKSPLVNRRNNPLPREPHHRNTVSVQSRRHYNEKNQHALVYSKAVIRNRHGAKPFTYRDIALNDKEYAWKCFSETSHFVRNQPACVSGIKGSDEICSSDLYALRMVIPQRRIKYDKWSVIYDKCMK